MTANQPASREPRSAQALRDSARGLYAAEAAVELLINHGVWLRRSAFTGQFVHHVDDDGSCLAYIAWADAITALDNGEMPCSGSEASVLRLAASIGDGAPVDLRDTLTGLDQRNIAFVVQAVHHANGRRP